MEQPLTPAQQQHQPPLMCAVKDGAKAEHVRTLVREAFISARASHIPVDNPVSMDAHNIELLCEDPYAVAYKADGVRYLLVLCMYNRRPLACFVDRAGKVYSLYVKARPAHFEHGTVLDGELCHVTTGRVAQDFLVFNCLRFQGQSLARTTYLRRLTHVRRCVSAEPIQGSERAKYDEVILAGDYRLHIVQKEVGDATQLRNMLHTRPPRYSTDGFVFTPLLRHVVPGRDDHLLKWKNDNPLDVLVTQWQAGEACRVDVDDAGDYRLLSEALDVSVHLDAADAAFAAILRGAAVSARLLGTPPTEPGFSFVVEVDCRLARPADNAGAAPTELRLRYLRLRPDKDGPNNVETVRRTLTTIEDNVQLQDIYNVLERAQQARDDAQRRRQQEQAAEPASALPPQEGQAPLADATPRRHSRAI